MEGRHLLTLTISRCDVTLRFGEVKKYKVHHCSDASYDGCGQCSYLRTIYENRRITSSLTAAKSRVTPVRSVTIPQLELVGALISARVNSKKWSVNWEL